MSLPRVILSSLCVVAFAITLRAQAAVEYAAKSAGGTLANTAAGMRVGVCPVDSVLVSCVHRQYPVPFYAVLIAICFLLGRLVYPKRRV